MDTNSIKDTTEAIKGIVEAVPIYQDLAQPTVQEVGKNLHTISKAISCAFLPLRLMVWKCEDIEKNIKNGLNEKLKNEKPENIATPNPRVAGPLLESLRFTAQEEELREMYTSLLANSMIKNKKDDVHPSFVEIIKQLQPDEAKLLKEIAFNNAGTHGLLEVRKLSKDGKGGTTFIEKFCSFYDSMVIEDKHRIPLYIENLERLKLISIPSGSSLTNKDYHYKPLKEHPNITLNLQFLTSQGFKHEFKESYLQLTEFGKAFTKVCI